MEPIHKLSKKLYIPETVIKEIIVRHHILQNNFELEKQKEVSFNLNMELKRFVKRIAKKLKVCEEAVLYGIIKDQIENDFKGIGHAKNKSFTV